MVDSHIRNGGHTSTVLGEAEEVGASALGAAAALLSIQLSKISSKIAKFHLQIVENRLQFRSKILPERVRDVVNRRLAKALEELVRAELDEPAHTNTPKRMREW